MDDTAGCANAEVVQNKEGRRHRSSLRTEELPTKPPKNPIKYQKNVGGECTNFIVFNTENTL